MSANFRFPNITGLTEKEQIAQIRSYLHQLVEQLNYVVPTLESGGVAQEAASVPVQGADVSYYELRSLIVRDLQEIEKRFSQLEARLEAEVDATIKAEISKISITIDDEGNIYYEVEE